MSEEGKSRKVGKSGSPKGRKKPDPDSYRDGGPKSDHGKNNPLSAGWTGEIEEHSAPESYRVNIPHSEITQPFTTHNSPLTTMEVHHHPDIEKKGLKEYLLEGLMIFLAVMMGFFAERIRENLSDQAKGREYAINIKKDLVTDAENLNVWLPSLYQRVLNFDTLITCLETAPPVRNGSTMYYLARLSTRNSVFEPSNNTILEMKSSGNLRLIQNREIVNGLMDIERSVGQYINLFDIESKENVLSYPLLGELFDATVFDKMVIIKNKALTEREYAAGSVNNTLRPPGNPQLLTYDKG